MSSIATALYEERGEQVDPQPTPASSSDTGTSMQDVDGDDEEALFRNRFFDT